MQFKKYKLTEAMFTLYRIAFAPARNPYPIELLFTHKNSDFSAISVTEKSCTAPISKVESHIRVHIVPDSCFSCRPHKLPGMV